jgi:hypothetical protein
MNKSTIRGQSLVEFALIFPVVIFMLLGFLDIGRAIFYYSSLSNAVREGTRAGIVNRGYLEDAKSGADLGKAVMAVNPICPAVVPTQDTLRCIVYRYGFALANELDPITDITPQVITDENNLNSKLQITATYCYIPVTPGIMLIVGTECATGVKGIILTAQSTMYVAPVGR